MKWDFVPSDIAKQIGLSGSGHLRFHNDCIYMRDENGNWWELQVPKLPTTLPA